MNSETVKFFATARERYNMLLRRQRHIRGDRLTADPILKTYRFCNVFREDDKVTTWFRMNVRDRLPQNKLMHVRAATAFRWFNLPATGELLLPWLLGNESIVDAEAKVAERQAAGHTILNAAYMIKSPPGVSKTYGLFSCLRVVEDALEGLTTDMVIGNHLQRAHELLLDFPYLGPFMAYQIVCDLRFTCVLDRALDINTWTCPGPGSARGISRIKYQTPNKLRYTSRVDQDIIREEMRHLLAFSRNHELWPREWPSWELSTVQHWACEYDKYMRAMNGEGEPKQKYTPSS